MHDSVTYQAVLDEGRGEEARKLLLLQGERRFGPPDAATVAAVRAITDLERLERLGVRLLEVDSWAELLATP